MPAFFVTTLALMRCLHRAVLACRLFFISAAMYTVTAASAFAVNVIITHIILIVLAIRTEQHFVLAALTKPRRRCNIAFMTYDLLRHSAT